jgi:hypothetical protein
MVKLPNGTQVHVAVEKMDKDKVILSKKKIIIEQLDVKNIFLENR